MWLNQHDGDMQLLPGGFDGGWALLCQGQGTHWQAGGRCSCKGQCGPHSTPVPAQHPCPVLPSPPPCPSLCPMFRLLHLLCLGGGLLRRRPLQLAHAERLGTRPQHAVRPQRGAWLRRQAGAAAAAGEGGAGSARPPLLLQLHLQPAHAMRKARQPAYAEAAPLVPPPPPPRSKIRPWNAAATRDREGGERYRRWWEAALDAQPAAVSITSFNEWVRGCAGRVCGMVRSGGGEVMPRFPGAERCQRHKEWVLGQAPKISWQWHGQERGGHLTPPATWARGGEGWSYYPDRSVPPSRHPPNPPSDCLCTVQPQEAWLHRTA